MIFDRHAAVLLRFLVRRVGLTQDGLVGEPFRIAFERRSGFDCTWANARLLALRDRHQRAGQAPSRWRRGGWPRWPVCPPPRRRPGARGAGRPGHRPDRRPRARGPGGCHHRGPAAGRAGRPAAVRLGGPRLRRHRRGARSRSGPCVRGSIEPGAACGGARTRGRWRGTTVDAQRGLRRIGP
jgi:hypothetical protein